MASLTRLPSTTASQQRRAELEARHRRALAELESDASGSETPPESLAETIRDQLEQQHSVGLLELDLLIADCAERDRIQAGRPAGCICLGAGGTGYLLPFVSYPLWSSWCSCPDGEELRAEARRVDAEIEAERADEQARRKAAELAIRIERANLPPRLGELDFDDFDGDEGKAEAVGHLRGLDPTNVGPGGRVREPGARSNRGAYLFGPVGTGKSTLAALAVRHWVQAGGSALFLPVSELLDMLRPGGREMAEEVADSQSELMQRLLGTGLLVLDDLGAQRETGWTRERLFLIVNRRYDAGRLTIITSNYSLGEMAARLAGNDERIEGDRIAWRIREVCELIRVDGENYRARPESTRGTRKRQRPVAVANGVLELPL